MTDANAPMQDKSEKPTRMALEHLENAVKHLDKQTEELQTQLSDLLKPEESSPNCTEEESLNGAASTSILSSTLRNLTTDVNNIAVRIENILVRLEI